MRRPEDNCIVVKTKTKGELIVKQQGQDVIITGPGLYIKCNRDAFEEGRLDLLALMSCINIVSRDWVEPCQA